jgi:hypothetical protein
VRARELDQIESAHALVVGAAQGRRYLTQQLNRAYALRLSSQFQGFCRDLHTETVDFLVAVIPPVAFRVAMREELLWNRQLDRGNAHQGSIRGDFGRLGIRDFWAKVDARAAGNDQRRQRLDLMNEWRNAIAHQDFDPSKFGGTVLRLRQVKSGRQSCRVLARSFDDLMRDYVQSVTGVAPW